MGGEIAVYDYLYEIPPWVVVAGLAAIIVALLVLVCRCLQVCARQRNPRRKLTGLPALRRAYCGCGEHQPAALIYVDISLHRMRNRHSQLHASEGYQFVGKYLQDRVAACPETFISQVDGKNFLILSREHQQAVLCEVNRLTRHMDRYAAERGVVNLPEIHVGYYAIDGSGVSFEEAVYRVRQVCKQAAENGKNFCVYDYEELRRQELRERLEILIDRYIQENRFYLEFQPFVDLESQKVIGGEVLTRMRWENEGDIIMPTQFLRAVESVGCQWKFDCYVFEKCCAWLSC